MIITYNSGCLLPFLILINLFFGRIIFSTRIWLSVEAVLILLFLINSYIFSHRVFKSVNKKRSNVVDVEAEVVDDVGRKKENKNGKFLRGAIKRGHPAD